MSLPETPTRVVLFLSTLSLRRATFLFADHIELRAISIHALLAESDQPATKQAQNLLNFYPRSPCGERPGINPDQSGKTDISIHALLAESDGFYAGLLLANADFYPRSPCGERPAEGERVSYTYAISIHALLAESDRVVTCHNA